MTAPGDSTRSKRCLAVISPPGQSGPPLKNENAFFYESPYHGFLSHTYAGFVTLASQELCTLPNANKNSLFLTGTEFLGIFRKPVQNKPIMHRKGTIVSDIDHNGGTFPVKSFMISAEKSDSTKFIASRNQGYVK